MSDCVVVPSVEDTAPLVVTEALMCGTPVVSFQVGVAPDLIVQGKNGFLASTCDATGLAEAVDLFLESKGENGMPCREEQANMVQSKCCELIQMESFKSLLNDRTVSS
jgi:glycosyltransferase involved in cell wall biosynthesis